MSSRRALLLALAVAGCGPLPQPFRGNPGRTARRLARPPAYRIAVALPEDARLLDADARILTESLVEALAAQDLLVVSGPGLPLDWRLSLLTEWQGGIVLPRFILRDADGLVTRHDDGFSAYRQRDRSVGPLETDNGCATARQGELPEGSTNPVDWNINDVHLITVEVEQFLVNGT